MQPQLKSVVTRLLEEKLSPEHLSGWLKRHSPHGKTMCISHEKIYRSLFTRARGMLREELKKNLRLSECFVMPEPTTQLLAKEFPVRFEFGNALRMSKAERFQAIGKGI
ncbi:hypothetical protein DIC66_04600 [Rhodoferax lacus]|uniref:Uncharacterized protein n=2 Tax=Rhodoferax lacus TaxID=2184758 RepID=A0A3E1RHC1_9BURK|nr:hypothetical protein DIC66_04600 [Rhodoferax lacus]